MSSGGSGCCRLASESSTLLGKRARVTFRAGCGCASATLKPYDTGRQCLHLSTESACLVHETRYNIGSELVVKESVRAVVCATKACLLHRLIADKLSVYRIRLESKTPCADYIFLCGGK